MWFVDERIARFVADDMYRIADAELREGEHLARAARFFVGGRCQRMWQNRQSRVGRIRRVGQAGQAEQMM